MTGRFDVRTGQPYPAYKPSGVEWLGDVPAHWEVTAVKRHYAIQLGKMLQNGQSAPDDTAVSYLKAQHVQWFHVRTNDLPTMWASPSDLGQFGVTPGDLLVCEGGEGGRCGILKQGGDGLIIQNALHRVRPRTHSRNEFLQYALSAAAATGWLAALNEKATIAHLTGERFGTLKVALPPLSEQIAIARFLDHINRRITRYIDAKEKLIARLHEYRQVMVSDAVTGRFNVRTGQPYPAYKPSGTEWLGEVPAHWEVRRLGQIGTFSKGRGGSKEDESQSGVPCIRYGDLYTTHQYFIEKSRAFVPLERAAKYTPLKFGDLLFAASGETTGEIGKSAVNLISSDACCAGDVILFRARRKMEARYLGYAADCRPATIQKAAMGRGFTVIHIYRSQLKHLSLALPPLPEQIAIARFLDGATDKIQKNAAQIQKEIDLLREYRTRLIADVVTGKLDVRAAASALPEIDPLADTHGMAALPDANGAPAVVLNNRRAQVLG